MKKTIIMALVVMSFITKTPLEAIPDSFCPTTATTKAEFDPVDAMLMAFMLRSECHDCSLEEKESLSYILFKRAKFNYGKFGKTIKKQLFAPSQFNGVKTTNFRFEIADKTDQENLRVAELILKGKIPRYSCENCFSFGLNGKGAIKTPDYFRHKIKDK